MRRAILILLVLVGCEPISGPLASPLQGGWNGGDRDVAFYPDRTFLFRAPVPLGMAVYSGTYEQERRTITLYVAVFQTPGGGARITRAVWVWDYALDGDTLLLAGHVYRREA